VIGVAKKNAATVRLRLRDDSLVDSWLRGRSGRRPSQILPEV
jgi:hypothetical protein